MSKVNWPITLVTGNQNKLREALQILGKDYENKVRYSLFEIISLFTRIPH